MESKIKVLIVDDEYSFCKALKAFLEKNGYEAVFTTNGEQALDMLQEEKPDIMTLDLRMPGIDGYEVLEAARKINLDMPIIIISAIDIPKFEESLKSKGASAVFNKPMDLGALLAAVREHAGEHKEG